MKNVSIIAVCMFCITTLFAQRPAQSKSFIITGKVIDKDTKEPLEYATAVFKNLKSQKISGGIFSKYFTISNCCPEFSNNSNPCLDLLHLGLWYILIIFIIKLS